MRKKIGILTYFADCNPGTFLQAYSTLHLFQEKHPNDTVEFINCRPKVEKFKLGRHDLNLKYFIERYSWHQLYTKIVAEQPKSSESIVSYNYTELTKYIKNQKYDLIIVGADTILEITPQHFDKRQIPIYWLPPEIKCKKVMFSASAGALIYDMIDQNSREILSASVKSFDLVGVRDDNTLRLVKQLGLDDESKLFITPDPTFCMDIDYTLIERYLKRTGIDLKKPTIAVYLPDSLSIAKDLADYYQQHNFSVLMKGAWRKKDIRFPLMSPFEWAGIHKYFVLEITDRFHGSIFALKNLTPPVAIDFEDRKRTPDGLSKTYSLLKMFNMHSTNHINTVRTNNLEEIISTCSSAIGNFDAGHVAKRLFQLKIEYKEFMNKVSSLLD
jgi:polysaccharide pyruvyl transferase WcaK-like protein